MLARAQLRRSSPAGSRKSSSRKSKRSSCRGSAVYQTLCKKEPQARGRRTFGSKQGRELGAYVSESQGKASSRSQGAQTFSVAETFSVLDARCCFPGVDPGVSLRSPRLHLGTPTPPPGHTGASPGTLEGLNRQQPWSPPWTHALEIAAVTSLTSLHILP